VIRSTFPQTLCKIGRSSVPNVVDVVSWDDVVPEIVSPGIERRTVHGTRQTLVRYRYAPGTVFPSHSHPEEQITVVLTGTITFEIAGERYPLGPGQVAVIPGGVAHGAAVAGNEAVDTLNTLSPRREAAPSISAETGR